MPQINAYFLMRKWTRQPQEKEGDYYFDGKIYITRGIQEMLREVEIFSIIMDVKKAVFRNAGLDYLQVYKSDLNEKIYLIDNLSKTDLTSDDLTEEEKRIYNYFTMLLPAEY